MPGKAHKVSRVIKDPEKAADNTGVKIHRTVYSGSMHFIQHKSYFNKKGKICEGKFNYENYTIN